MTQQPPETQPGEKPGVPSDVPLSTQPPRASTNAPGFKARLLHEVPTLLVLVLLAGIAWWGHHSGWKIPKLADLTGASASAWEEDWCGEHNVPESICMACHPELAGANPKDWCKEHGVAESQCTICHPEILTAGVAGDWCKEHGVPESGCLACHSEIAIKGNVAAADLDTTVPSPAGDISPRESGSGTTAVRVNHERPDMSRAQPLITRPGKDPKTCQTHARRVQFASPESVKKAGIRLAVVREQPMASSLSVNAETNYDRTRFAQIASPVAGRVWRIEKQLGQTVKQGDVLALVESAEVGRAKAELLETSAVLEMRQSTLQRVRASTEAGTRTAAELQEAEAAVKEASIRVFNALQSLMNLGLSLASEDASKLRQDTMQFLGFPAAMAQSLHGQTSSANLLPLRAPFDGVVVGSSAVAGEIADPSKPVLAIADTSRLWVVMDLPVTEARRVALGQEVVFQPDAARDETFLGQVSWISSAVDDQTRTLKVRAEVPNPDGRLLAMSWGRAQIVLRQMVNAMAIPDSAIQWEGCCHVAFVRWSDTVFQTRKLRLGAKAGGLTEVVVGVMPGEVVATTGSNVLKSEILKSNLGAGCADH